jgi:hypothetical protein
MEVTIKHQSKYSFRIERLKSFKDMGTWTRIYLDNDVSFDIDENYYDFLERLKKYN